MLVIVNQHLLQIGRIDGPRGTGLGGTFQRDMVELEPTARHVSRPVSRPRLLRTTQRKGLCLSIQEISATLKIGPLLFYG